MSMRPCPKRCTERKEVEVRTLKSSHHVTSDAKIDIFVNPSRSGKQPAFNTLGSHASILKVPINRLGLHCYSVCAPASAPLPCCKPQVPLSLAGPNLPHWHACCFSESERERSSHFRVKPGPPNLKHVGATPGTKWIRGTQNRKPPFFGEGGLTKTKAYTTSQPKADKALGWPGTTHPQPCLSLTFIGILLPSIDFAGTGLSQLFFEQTSLVLWASLFSIRGGGGGLALSG